MQSKKRRRVLFSIREPDWLILFNRMKGRAGFAMIYMAIPIHSMEGGLNKVCFQVKTNVFRITYSQKYTNKTG